jgi:dienelactone hydrolase
MTSPRASRRALEQRRRRLAVALGVAVVALAVAFAFSATGLFGAGTDGRTREGAAARSSTTTAASTAPTSTVAAAAPSTPAAPSTDALRAVPVGQTYAVGTRTATFVDPSRTTSPNGSFGGARSRTLPTQFWYPAEGTPGGDPQADAPPDRGHGPYPLVLFAHGYAVTPDFYAALLQRWAAAGYVVAAPVFPILSGTPGGASHVDYVKTWDDAKFVIGQILTLSADDPLARLVDPTRIAATGHSDGQLVAFAEGFLACCRDVRVRSVIAMAGDLSFSNNPMVANTGTPILHIMETGDEYDPYEHSIAWDRENLTSPRWLLSLNSTHVPPYTQPGDPAFELVSKVTIAFLDGTLKGSADHLEQVTSDVVAAPDVGTLER